MRNKDDATRCILPQLCIRSVDAGSLRFDVKSSGIVGEIGFDSPDNRRTQTFICTEGGELLVIIYGHIRRGFWRAARPPGAASGEIVSIIHAATSSAEKSGFRVSCKWL
ncbi:hypothetical protein V1291_005394 [Nitrobacteraceae bacterium AZCC 1564]